MESIFSYNEIQVIISLDTSHIEINGFSFRINNNKPISSKLLFNSSSSVITYRINSLLDNTNSNFSDRILFIEGKT